MGGGNTGYDYAALCPYKEERGIRWPVNDKQPAGTGQRYVEGDDPFVPEGTGLYFYGKPDGKAVIYARPHRDPAEMPDDEYPFFLSTGRILEHWHTITMTKRVPEIMKGAGEFYCEIHEEDAARLGIRNGDEVRLTSAADRSSPPRTSGVVRSRRRAWSCCSCTMTASNGSPTSSPTTRSTRPPSRWSTRSAPCGWRRRKR